jgi:hypothetical protein
VDVQARAIEVFSDPDAAAGSDRRIRTVTAAETLASEAPELSFPVAPLFG